MFLTGLSSWGEIIVDTMLFGTRKILRNWLIGFKRADKSRSDKSLVFIWLARIIVFLSFYGIR